MTQITETPSSTSPGTQRVEARRLDYFNAGLPATSLEQDLLIARTLAKLMDAQFQIGPIKFGLDSLIGLVPIAGDFASFTIGMYPVYLARKHRLGKLIVARMMMNLGLDFAVGVVPLAGDLLDVAVKANLKNFALLERAIAKRTA